MDIFQFIIHIIQNNSLIKNIHEEIKIRTTAVSSEYIQIK